MTISEIKNDFIIYEEVTKNNCKSLLTRSKATGDFYLFMGEMKEIVPHVMYKIGDFKPVLIKKTFITGEDIIQAMEVAL